MNFTVVLWRFLICIVRICSMGWCKISSRCVLLETCNGQDFLNHRLIVLKRSMHLWNGWFKVLAIDVTIDRRLGTVSAFLLSVGWFGLIWLSYDQTVEQSSFSLDFSFGLFFHFIETLNYSCWFLLYLFNNCGLRFLFSRGIVIGCLDWFLSFVWSFVY